MWISLSDSSYVTTAVESDSSLPQTSGQVVQMKPGTFCTTLSVFFMTYVYVRVLQYACVVCHCGGCCCCCHCVSWWLLCLSCMSHSTHLSFLGCPCHDEFFSASGLLQTNILQVYISIFLNIRMFTHMHKWNSFNHCASSSKIFIFLAQQILGLPKPPLQQHWLSQWLWDKSCVGGVSSALCTTTP